MPRKRPYPHAWTGPLLATLLPFPERRGGEMIYTIIQQRLFRSRNSRHTIIIIGEGQRIVTSLSTLCSGQRPCCVCRQTSFQITEPRLYASKMNFCDSDGSNFTSCLVDGHITVRSNFREIRSLCLCIGSSDIGNRCCITALLQLCCENRDSNSDQHGLWDGVRLPDCELLIMLRLLKSASFPHLHAALFLLPHYHRFR